MPNAQYNSWRGCANDFSTRRYANAVVERSDALSVVEVSKLSTSAQCPIPNTSTYLGFGSIERSRDARHKSR
ncbi:MAG: hypothetical protein V7K50_10365 [Nostoc sp.]